jgi:bidirectional [NiFe] hydrogenase diaphorase subunit
VTAVNTITKREELQLQLGTEPECSHHCNTTQVQKIGGNVPILTPPPLPSDDKRWKIVNGTMRKNDFAHHVLIETLHTVQSSFGYLEDDSIRFVAKSLRVPRSQVYGVVISYHHFVIFYHHFSLKPPGKHTIEPTIPAELVTAGYRQTRRCGREAPWRSARTDHQGREQIRLMTARCVGARGRALR